MSDKTETETLGTGLSILSQVMSHRGHRVYAEITAKASLRLHDQAEEIERPKAELQSAYERGFDAGAARVIVSRPPDVASAYEKIERLEAEIAALKDAAHYATGTAELAIRHRDEAEARAEKAYDDGWRTAANWMDRAELHDDIGSPAYIADRDAALGRSLLSVG